MLASERHQHILKSLDEKGSIRTVDLAEELDVTDETIRRDLQILAEAHQITRTHGGATSLNGRPKLQSFAERRAINVELKSRIAQAALDLIEPGQTYAFDSSTTAYELVLSLPDLPYRVVTNAYSVIDHLIRMTNVELVSTGGRYQHKTQTFSSNNSHDILRRHNIHIAFISCIGLDTQRGASEGFEEQAEFKEVLVKCAQKVVLLVDSSKLNKQSEYFFAALNDLNHIITDSGASPKCLEALQRQGCKVTIAE